VLGLLGAIGGLAAGILFAGGINALFKAIGADLPNTGTVVLGRTVIVSLLIGVVVTLVAALAPALRATRITPMAALRESELQDSKPRGRLTLIAALLLGGLGLALMLIGLFGGIEESGTAAGLLGGGAALILFATSLFSPRLVRPLASLAGKPMERIRGLTGRLARENAMRKPGRTATTAAALMIGLALVTFVTVFAAGLKSSIANTIDENFKSDVILQNTDGFSPIPRDAVTAASDVDGVANISAVTYGSGEYKGEQIRVAGIDPETINGVLSLDFVDGSPAVLRGLNDREAVADEAWADSKGLEVGDTVSVRTPLEKRAIYTIRGEIEGGLDLFGKMLVNDATLQPLFGADQPSLAFVRLEHGASAAMVQSDLEAARAARYPTVEVQNQEQLKENQESQVNALLLLVYALLSLAVIVSLFGIVNTLALSIHERTRELGMLRAVGMSRRQVRTMVRYEAVITALIGAILGMVLGVLMAALVSRPLADEGFTLSYPIATLILLLALAALAGVVAAIGPARRASRIDVLRALAYE
jgi:putative ABC transport system permease protein